MVAHRRRPALIVVALALIVLATRTAHALTVVVPDAYPTIQAAIASAATQILVRNGTYSENLTIARGVSLEPVPHGYDGQFTPQSDNYPKIAGSVDFQSSPAAVASIRGFQITGTVTIHSTHLDITIADSHIDGGIVRVGEADQINIHGCIVRLGINATGIYGDITGNTVLGGGITTFSSVAGCCMAVRSNYVVGPAPIGINFADNGTNGIVTGNTVAGCTKGIVIHAPSGTNVTNNLVEDCSGNGYEASGGNESESLTLSINTAVRCGGNAYDMSGIPILTMDGNYADNCSGYGIRLVSCGKLGSPPPPRPTLSHNFILRSGSDGIHADGCPILFGNIVGRSHGRGIVVANVGSRIDADHNTSYWNDGDGYALSTDGIAVFNNNVAYGNQHKGLVWTGTGTLTLTCNDWFANVTGTTSGIAPGATDLFVDPLFCNVPADNVHLTTFSPLHNAPGCGLIGALDIACSEPTGVSSPIGRASFSARPQPTLGSVRFDWATQSAPGEIEIYDATGARRWHAKVGAGATSMDWRGIDGNGNTLPSGIYFAKLSRGGAVETARVVIAR